MSKERILYLDVNRILAFVTTALTLIGSLLITWLLSLLPFGIYIVGYKNKLK